MRSAVINEDATDPDLPITCVIPSFSPDWTTDPAPWIPVTLADGIYYPKRGDVALVADPDDGPDVVVWWKPSAGAAPDVSF